jgi:hypothetical protein
MKLLRDDEREKILKELNNKRAFAVFMILFTLPFAVAFIGLSETICLFSFFLAFSILINNTIQKRIIEILEQREKGEK